jgi:hypothetical protein
MNTTITSSGRVSEFSPTRLQHSIPVAVWAEIPLVANSPISVPRSQADANRTLSAYPVLDNYAHGIRELTSPLSD